jgi:hypothetical protein
MRRFFAWLLSKRYGLCESWDDTFFSPLVAFSVETETDSRGLNPGRIAVSYIYKL